MFSQFVKIFHSRKFRDFDVLFNLLTDKIAFLLNFVRQKTFGAIFVSILSFLDRAEIRLNFVYFKSPFSIFSNQVYLE